VKSQNRIAGDGSTVGSCLVRQSTNYGTPRAATTGPIRKSTRRRPNDRSRRTFPIRVGPGERPFSERTTAVRRGQRNRARHRCSERRTGFESKGSETM